MRRGEDLTELLEYYPYGRDAWNAKAAWLDQRAPAYLSTAYWGDRPEPYPTALSEDARYFFTLLAGERDGGGPPRGRDIDGNVAQQEQAMVFPHIQRTLDGLRNQCRNGIGKGDTRGMFHVRRMPDTWEEFVELL